MTQGTKSYMGYRIKSLEVLDDEYSEIVLAPLPKPQVRVRVATRVLPKMIAACFLSDCFEVNVDAGVLLIAQRSCVLESFEELEIKGEKDT